MRCTRRRARLGGGSAPGMFDRASRSAGREGPSDPVASRDSLGGRTGGGDDMARRPVVLVTGGSGEMAHALHQPPRRGRNRRRPRPRRAAARSRAGAAGCAVSLTGDIRDRHLLERLRSEFEIHAIYHLAAILSTRAEFVPEPAHQVNVEGTLNLLGWRVEEAALAWPSRARSCSPARSRSTACPISQAKRTAGPVSESDVDRARSPCTAATSSTASTSAATTARHYRQLAAEAERARRRLPRDPLPRPRLGLHDCPAGGTSDYAPEMIHAAAQGRPYACFVREDTRIPFMAMPDAVDALLALARGAGRAADAARCTT